MNMMDVINPRTGKVDYQIPDQESHEVSAVAVELRTAQANWSDNGLAYRIETLKKWRDSIARHSEAIGDALTIDTGRSAISRFEVFGILERIDYLVDRAPEILGGIKSGTSTMVPSVEFSYRKVPYPVAGVISPWNVPLTLALIDALPALLAGSAVLLKPSEITPRFAEPLAKSIAEVPELESVFKIVTGGANTGIALIDNVDVICFTGSVATGKKVALQAAKNFIPAFLELGGKDPAIVLPSADLDNAATAILRSAAGLTGQACQSLERIYVHESVYDRFLEKLVTATGKIRVNWPDIHSGHLGPFIFQPQANKVQEQLDDARSAGAEIHTGGEVQCLDGGYYCLPTVITGVDHQMKLMNEETFGPVLPVMPFRTVEEAIALANDSDFGLSGAVFGGTRDEAEAVAVRLLGGAISVNDASLTAGVHDVEKNAFCLSGMGGSRMGDAGLLRFFRTQAILYQTAAATSLEVFDEANAP